VLQHGAFWVYETTAIAMYIDESFDGPRLLPEDPRERAIAQQWMSSLNAYFYPSIVFGLLHERLVFADLGIPADEAVVADSIPKIVRCLDVLSKALDEHHYVVANDVTMADYFLLPTLTALSFVPDGRSLLERHPPIGAWLQRMGRLSSVRELLSTLPPAAPIEHARRWVEDHRARVTSRA
jgi:glutathione S-transferase